MRTLRESRAKAISNHGRKWQAVPCTLARPVAYHPKDDDHANFFLSLICSNWLSLAMLKHAIHGDARCMDRVGTFIDRIQIVERFIAVHDLARPVVIYGICGSAAKSMDGGVRGWGGRVAGGGIYGRCRRHFCAFYFYFSTFSSLHGQESSSLTLLLNHIGNVVYYFRQRAIAPSRPIDFWRCIATYASIKITYVIQHSWRSSECSPSTGITGTIQDSLRQPNYHRHHLELLTISRILTLCRPNHRLHQRFLSSRIKGYKKSGPWDQLYAKYVRYWSYSKAYGGNGIWKPSQLQFISSPIFWRFLDAIPFTPPPLSSG